MDQKRIDILKALRAKSLDGHWLVGCQGDIHPGTTPLHVEGKKSHFALAEFITVVDEKPYQEGWDTLQYVAAALNAMPILLGAVTGMELLQMRLDFVTKMAALDHNVQLNIEGEFQSESTNAMWVGWQAAKGAM